MSASHGRATNERPLSLRSSLGEVTTDSSLGFRGVARIGLIRCNPCEQISLGVRRLQGYNGFAVLKKKRRQQNTSARSPKKSICRFFCGNRCCEQLAWATSAEERCDFVGRLVQKGTNWESRRLSGATEFGWFLCVGESWRLAVTVLPPGARARLSLQKSR